MVGNCGDRHEHEKSKDFAAIILIFMSVYFLKGVKYFGSSSWEKGWLIICCIKLKYKREKITIKIKQKTDSTERTAEEMEPYEQKIQEEMMEIRLTSI